MSEQGGKNKGHGAGSGVFGGKNPEKVANQCRPGSAKGTNGHKVGKVNPGSNKGSE